MGVILYKKGAHKDMNIEKLNKVLENHKHWLNKDCEGWESMRANLKRADLRGANLTDANLKRAILRGANLTDAHLTRANLTRADLGGANLTYANLTGAKLTRAILRGANLTYANLIGADLIGADLTIAHLTRTDLTEANLRRADLIGANLTRSDLRGANLIGAIFTGANLTGVILTDTNLSGVYLRGAKNIPYIPYSCPDFGMFIGYKKASGYIVELEIPADAKRLSATTRKCRCNKAKVLRILNFDRTIADITEVKSSYDNSFIYKVGEVVSVENFDDNRWNECSTGIYFFINFQEAVNY